MSGKKLIHSLILGVWCSVVLADNPLVTHIFNADPSTRYYDGVLYVYPSHDVDEAAGDNNFSMKDYHVFSSTDMMNFKDHGVALSQDDVAWAKRNNTFWAPDCIKKGDKYYFYFPTHPKDKDWGHTGVAIGDSPTGPFKPEPEYIPHANNIDPNIFIDDDGTPYLYICANENIKFIRLQQNMLTGVSWKPEDQGFLVIDGADSHYKEGPWMFKRGDTYYLTYPSGVANEGGEAIHYTTGTSPTGPFKYQGIIMDGWGAECWTIHHSILTIEGQWYIFYHGNKISGDPTLRSIAADKLYFNEDGSIKKVTPTRRGIGIRKANEEIQIDRYVKGSRGLTTPVFSKSVPSGFYLSGINNESWVGYSDVDFGTKAFTSVTARVACGSAGGTIDIHTGSKSPGRKPGQVIGSIKVTSTGGESEWKEVSGSLNASAKDIKGVKDLHLEFKGEGSNLFNVDWIRFE